LQHHLYHFPVGTEIQIRIGRFTGELCDEVDGGDPHPSNSDME
jgi:hypothetical protein